MPRSTFFFFSLMPRARAPITGFFVTIILVVALGGLTVLLYVASILLNLDSSLTGKYTRGISYDRNSGAASVGE